MSIDVLVVDDDLIAAEEFANLIHVKTQLVAVATDDPEVAIERIRTEPIKVAVLDQKMPKKRGTALLEDLLNIDPLLRVVMLSGQAEAGEVGEGFTHGLVDYVHKSNVAQLPDKVLLHFIRYCVDASYKDKVENAIVVYKTRPGIPFGSRITYQLQRLEVIDDEFIFEDKWVTLKQLNAGESSREVDKISIEQRFVHEQSNEAKLSSYLALTHQVFLGIKMGIETAIASRFKTGIYSTRTQSIEVTREYRLPAEPADPTQLHVVSRHYQRAPVYRRIRSFLVRNCGCCGIQQPFPLVVYQLTSKIATRQREYFSDGTTREINTGIETH